MREFISLTMAEVAVFHDLWMDSLKPLLDETVPMSSPTMNPIMEGELMINDDGHEIIHFAGDFWKASDDCLLSVDGKPFVAHQRGPVSITIRDGVSFAIVEEDGRFFVERP